MSLKLAAFGTDPSLFMLLRRNAIGGMGVGPMRKECAWDFSSAKRVFLGGEGEEAAA